MKNLLFKSITKLAFVFIISVVFFGCNSMDCISGSGNIITIKKSLDEFNKVDFGGAISLKIIQSDSSYIHITTDDNVQNYITTSITNKVLKIRMDGSFCDYSDISAVVSSKNWNGINVSGASEIYSDQLLNSDNFDIDLSGASKVDIQLNASRLNTHASGASKIKLSGQCREHNLELSGSNEIDALDFVVSDYTINSSGSTRCDINVLNNLTVRSSGSSTVNYKGSPKNIINEKSGASSLNKLE